MYIFAILALALLTSCSSFSDLLGEKRSQKRLEGERLSILKLDAQLSPDKHIETIKINLPNQAANTVWSNSSGSEYNYPENIRFPQDLGDYRKFSLNLSSRLGYLTTTPVVVEDFIFIMDGKGEVKAYKQDNFKKPIWTKNTAPIDEKEEYAGGGMTYADGRLYITAGHKDIVALNIENGKEVWRHSLNNVIRAAPIFANNRLFVVTIDNKLYALDGDSGTLLWMHEGAGEYVGVFGSASIATNDNIVIIPHSSGQLHALDASSGRELWSANLAFNKTSLSGFAFTDIDVTPVIRNGVVYVAGNMGSLYAIDLQTGTPLWQREIKGIRSLWVAGDFIYLVDAVNELLCIHSIDGKIKWLKQLPQYVNPKKKQNNIIISGPVLAGNQLVLATNKGKLLFASPYDGSIKTEKNIPENVLLIPVVVSEQIYLLSNNGTLAIWQ